MLYKELRKEWRRLTKQYEIESLRNGRAFYRWRCVVSEDEKEHVVNNLTEEENVDNSKNIKYNYDVKYISGAVSGAINRDSKEAEKHAELFYEETRKRKSDIAKIAKRLNMDKSIIQEIKNYLFIDKHELEKGFVRFDASFDIANAWQRLQEPKSYLKKSDIILIKHEIREMQLVKKGMTQEDAHIEASKLYNYKKLVDDGE